MNTEVFGFISAICFGLCALPQSIKCIKTQSADGISTLMIILWLLGELSAIIYAIGTLNSPFWLLFNYGLSTITLLPIIYYKVTK
jgi:MtN3 and saliva related transmembrane protein